MFDPSTLAAAAIGTTALFAAKGFFRRKPQVQQIHLRGRALREAAEVANNLKCQLAPHDPGLLLGRRTFPSDIATRHFAFIGTTGSGKTLLQRLLMQSALCRIGIGCTRAVVYDAKQDVLSTLAGLRIDCPIYILNPLDARSVAWNMALDVSSPATALQVAATLVPESKNDANPFFSNAARQLLYGTLLTLIELAPTRWTFRHVLVLLRDPVRLQEFLSRNDNTRHLLTYFGHPATAQNILSTVLTYTSPYEIIAACWDRAEVSLSLTNWVKSESILVLGNDEQNRTAIDTINRLLFHRLAELALAGAEVDDQSGNPSRTWIFLDEVREAGKLELLGRLLTKGRSKGVAVALGFQDISGMREAYGRELADEILGQCNSKIILRLNSPETAAWAAKLFGVREVLETRRGQSRNRRLSLNGEASSGESFSHGIAQRPLVLDSEILGLPETSRELGLKAFFLSPGSGPFADHISSAWLSEHLMAPDRETQNAVPRPVAHQYLRPWSAEDDALFGFTATDSEPAPNSNRPGEAWCQ